MRHRLIDDQDEARELWDEMQQASGTTDHWPGTDHTYWRMEAGDRCIGICSAVIRPERGYVYLSYSVIEPVARGGGLQRQSINHRLRWARRGGAIYATTYATHDNFASIANLLRCGFRFVPRPTGWPGVARKDVHYFERPL